MLSTAPAYINHGQVPLSGSNVQGYAPYAPGSTFATSQAYVPEKTTYTTGNSSKFSPFQNIGGEQRSNYTQESPEVYVTDPKGGIHDDMANRARGSYITELSSMTHKQEGSQPFENINSKSRNRPGITQVKRSSGKYNDYG